jgi:hypothetical protein
MIAPFRSYNTGIKGQESGVSVLIPDP